MRYLFTLSLISFFLTSIAQSDTLQQTGKAKAIENARSENRSLKIAREDIKTLFYPTISFQNPLSPGIFGLVVVGGTLENKTRIADYPDANGAVYVGLGEPEKLVGAGVTINIYGVSNEHGEQNNLGQGSMSFHLNRLLLNKTLLLDAGVDNLLFWGGQQSYISYQRSMYFSGNYLLKLKGNALQKPFSYISVTAGVGNGYYRTDKNYTVGKSGSFDPFISVATAVVKGTNIIAEWNGYDIGAGVSSIPFQKIPFMFTFEVTDLNFGHPRVISSISIPFNFRTVKKGENLPLRPVFVKPIRSVRTI